MPAAAVTSLPPETLYSAAAELIGCRGGEPLSSLVATSHLSLVAARSITFSVDLRFQCSIYRSKALRIIYNFCEMHFFQIRHLTKSKLGLKLQHLRSSRFQPISCILLLVISASSRTFQSFPGLFLCIFSSLLSLVKPYKSIKYN